MKVWQQVGLILATSLLCACAVTRNESSLAGVMAGVDTGRLSQVRLHLIEAPVRTHNQGFESLHSLYHTADEVRDILRLVMGRYGMTEAQPGKQVYELELLEVMPDGGACYEEGLVGQEASAAVSLLTVGVTPAVGGQCVTVRAKLYYNDYEGRILVDEYASDAGRIAIYAGAREVHSYRRNVDRVMEFRAIEASMAGLLKRMLQDGAF